MTVIERLSRASLSRDRSPARAPSIGRLVEGRERRLDIAHPDERITQVVQDPCPLGPTVLAHGRGATEQVHGRDVIFPAGCPAPGRREPRAGPRPDRLGPIVWRRELRSICVGLLQVIRDDLLLLHDRVAPHALEPVGEALVELGTLALGDRLVRGVADQHVTEPEGVLAGQRASLGPDQLLTDERHQVLGHPWTRRLRYEVADRTHEELLADHGRGPERRPLVRRQAVQPRGQQRLDRGRHRDLRQVSGRDPPAVLARDQPVVD